jgi:hypothetical protein
MIVLQDSHISHIVNVPAHAIANMTTKGTGNSSSIPEALNIARAMSANAMPTSAQTIQDGKYEPKILREGAPSQPLNKPSIGAAHHDQAVSGHRLNAPPPNRVADTARCPDRDLGCEATSQAWKLAAGPLADWAATRAFLQENLSRYSWEGSVIGLSIANSPPFGGKIGSAGNYDSRLMVES